MGRKSKTRELIDEGLGQYLALSVAAHLARTNLVPNALKVYDSRHLEQMVDVVARALAKVASLYVQESDSTERRELTPEEIEGATISRSATLLRLKDGRKFSSVSVKRGDLRQAIAILKAVGIPEIASPADVDVSAPVAVKTDTLRVELLTRLGEIEKLLRIGSLLPIQVERVNHLAIWIARNASGGGVPKLAMQLLDTIQESQAGGQLDESARALLARLRAALHELPDCAQLCAQRRDL